MAMISVTNCLLEASRTTHVVKLDCTFCKQNTCSNVS